MCSRGEGSEVRVSTHSGRLGCRDLTLCHKLDAALGSHAEQSTSEVGQEPDDLAGLWETRQRSRVQGTAPQAPLTIREGHQGGGSCPAEKSGVCCGNTFMERVKVYPKTPALHANITSVKPELKAGAGEIIVGILLTVVCCTKAKDSGKAGERGGSRALWGSGTGW